MQGLIIPYTISWWSGSRQEPRLITGLIQSFVSHNLRNVEIVNTEIDLGRNVERFVYTFDKNSIKKKEMWTVSNDKFNTS